MKVSNNHCLYCL